MNGGFRGSRAAPHRRVRQPMALLSYLAPAVSLLDFNYTRNCSPKRGELTKYPETDALSGETEGYLPSARSFDPAGGELAKQLALPITVVAVVSVITDTSIYERRRRGGREIIKDLNPTGWTGVL
jgi:hypothetical protein